MERLRFNSDTISQHFPEVYKELCQKSTIVTSAPMTFYWFGEHSVLYGAPSVMSRLPVRLWCGIEPTSEEGVRIFDFYQYIPSSGKFVETVFEEPSRTRLQKFVEDYLGKYQDQIQLPGMNVRIVIETITGVGHNCSGAWAAALATGLALYAGQIEPDIVESWAHLPLPKLIAESKKNGFDEIFRLGWKIESIHHGGSSSGSDVFNALVTADEPVIYCGVERDGEGDSRNIPPVDVFPQLEVIDRLDYWGWRLSELVDLNPHAISWPIDFGLIYSGNTRSESAAIKATETVREELNSLTNSVTKWFHSNDVKDSKADPYFYTLTKRSKGYGFWKRFVQTLGIMTVEGIVSFKDLLTHGSNEETLRRFARVISQHHALLQLLRVSSRNLDEIYYAILNAAQNEGHELDTASKLTGAGFGGDMLFVAPIGQMHQVFVDLVAQLRRKTGRKIHLHYASWLDGIGKKGVAIEQSLVDNKYSKFVSKNSLRVLHLDREGRLHHDLFVMDEFYKNFPDMDIVCDLREHKMFLKGKQAQSDEIHSAKVTCDLLRLLAETPGQFIQHNLLQAGSYANDRTLMQSKIVTPFNQMAEKYLKQKKVLEIHGGLSDFALRLNHGLVDIHIIESIV